LLSASGLWPVTPDQGICPWTPLGYSQRPPI